MLWTLWLLITLLIFINLFGFTWLRYKRFPPPKRSYVNPMNKNDLIDYSNKVLEFARNTVLNVANFEYSTFYDTHNMNKLQRTHYAELASDIANKSFESINSENIMFTHTLFTKQFFTEYISQLSINCVKSVINKNPYLQTEE